MPPRRRIDPAFRLIFIALVAAALVLGLWQLSRQPAGPSRVAWPDRSAHP